MKLDITKAIGKEVFIVMKVNHSQSYSKPLKWIVKNAIRQSKCSINYDVVFATNNNEEEEVSLNSKHNMFILRFDETLQTSDLAFLDPLDDVDLSFREKECYVFLTREDALKFYKERLCEIEANDADYFEFYMKLANDRKHRLNEVRKALLVCNDDILSLTNK